jgi:hypothetical protein
MFTVRDSRIAARKYETREQALEAAGLREKATTTKDNAGAYLFGVWTINPNDADADQDIDGTQFRGGGFDTTDVINVDNEIPKIGSTPVGIATLHYEAPDGSVVVVDLALNGNRLDSLGCTLTGMAFGG